MNKENKKAKQTNYQQQITQIAKLQGYGHKFYNENGVNAKTEGTDTGLTKTKNQ